MKGNNQKIPLKKMGRCQKKGQPEEEHFEQEDLDELELGHPTPPQSGTQPEATRQGQPSHLPLATPILPLSSHQSHLATPSPQPVPAADNLLVLADETVVFTREEDRCILVAAQSNEPGLGLWQRLQVQLNKPTRYISFTWLDPKTAVR